MAATRFFYYFFNFIEFFKNITNFKFLIFVGSCDREILKEYSCQILSKSAD